MCWLKEPLLHFLLAGGLLFAAYAWINQGEDNEPRVVRISEAEVNWLRETWTRQWSRQPDEQELRGLVTGYLKEGLLAREAQELGLDENDTVVRRRLAQKMEFLVKDTARLAEPDEAELRRLYDDNRARYQTLARISFAQIYFRSEPAALQGLEDLATHSAAELGYPTLMERDYTDTDEQTVTSLFGPDFAEALFALEPSTWHGPVPSGYGFHLVRISEHQAAQPRPFDEVRSQLTEEWHRAQQIKTTEQFLAGLLKKYNVVVDESVKSLIGPLAEMAL